MIARIYYYLPKYNELKLTLYDAYGDIKFYLKKEIKKLKV